METARCRAFLQAAETGSFSRAAEKLNYTPSGVSQLVTAMEETVGFPLLHRSRKGVRLTEAGERLLPAVRAFLQQDARIEQIAGEIRRFPGPGGYPPAGHGLFRTAAGKRILPARKGELRGPIPRPTVV